MNQLIKLILTTMAGFAGGVIANDALKIQRANRAAGPDTPKVPITMAFQKAVQQPTLMRIIVGTLAAVVVAILLMTRANRRKLFR